MECSRCGGLLVSVILEHHESTLSPCLALRCITCGNVCDALIAHHRSASVRPTFRQHDSASCECRSEQAGD